MSHGSFPLRSHLPRVGVAVAAGALVAGIGATAGLSGAGAAPHPARTATRATTATAAPTCVLGTPGNRIQHVVYMQFDNVHYTRDNPNVPSDLKQMPALLNFLKNNGTFLTNEHTPLIAHTADDILTSETGVYGDQIGQPISNSYDYYQRNGTPNYATSFAYWTSPIINGSSSESAPQDTATSLVTSQGKIPPAPWVPYTRAGCNVGEASTADTEIENVVPDVATVFGANSPEAKEAASDPDQAVSDYEGLAIHCAKRSSVCSSANGGVPDVLADEPGGYHGYDGLFGSKFINPVISPSGPMKDLDGNPLPGFPGFDPTPEQSLAYVAGMLEHGVQVAYTYIADAHDNHSAEGTFGPGEQGYEQQLAEWNRGFVEFFANLKAHGIGPQNTLFVVTADEGDHFTGGPPSPAGCTGSPGDYCTYSKIGEVDANLTGMLAKEGIKTPFDIDFDSAPAVYINGQPKATAAVTRQFERAVGGTDAVDPYSGTPARITNYLANPTEMKLLHMVTGDPHRTPSFVLFANPDYYFTTYEPTCTPTNGCLSIEGPSGFAWNHGDVAPEINTTWLGFVGPGVRKLGVDHRVWADETDIRPTMMTLLGLHDDYSYEGRALTEVIDSAHTPLAVRSNEPAYLRLAEVFKQINAPVGAVGLDSLHLSTIALESDSPGDAAYTDIEGEIAQITATRNGLAAQMETDLTKEAFDNVAVPVSQMDKLIAAGEALIGEVATDSANA